MAGGGGVARALDGRVALVTGAGRRLGRAIAVALAADGARVAVHYHVSADGARETLATIERVGGRAAAYRADLRDPGASERLVADVAKDGARLDLLVNSAASFVRTPLGTVTPAEWDEIFALNLRAPFFLSLAAARAMGDSGGAIVNLSDHMGFESWPAFAPHGISKAAVSAMTRTLASALAPKVRVNAVAPGAVLPPEDWPEEERRRFAERTPLGRVGTPDDVAHAVLFLATAEYVTGVTLFVDGGRHDAP
ncbi:MAG TPA: SDR family oxidoreductase [Gemmatimonadaceae bacterium]|nr:SDR family oxidoreductase [Gemmatimonadaceae bacterium]